MRAMTMIEIPVTDGTTLPAYLGVEHEVVSYPGVGHAFFWPGTPPFDKTARDDAWARILALLGSEPPL